MSVPAAASAPVPPAAPTAPVGGHPSPLPPTAAPADRASRRQRTIAVVAIAAALPIIVGGILLARLLTGGATRGGAETAATSTTAESEDDNGDAPVDNATLQEVELGKRAWFDMFEIEVQSVTYDPQSGLVDVTTTFTNLGVDAATFDPFRTSLEVGGQSFTASGGDTPHLPGDGSGAGSLTYQVDADVDLADAVLILGEIDANQSSVPFGDGEVTTSEPQPLDLTGSAGFGPFTVTVSTGVLQPSWKPGEAGRLHLRVAVEVICTNRFDIAVAADWFSVRLADGTSAVAQPVFPDDLIAEAIGGGRSFTKMLTFLVPEAATAGEATIVFTEPRTREVAEIPFAL
ncbi:MAG: hypothetical protein ACRD29_18225 [Acidimicrobiales bacterium]